MFLLIKNYGNLYSSSESVFSYVPNELFGSLHPSRVRCSFSAAVGTLLTRTDGARIDRALEASFVLF
jgi:hypothetical protein